MMRAVTGDPNAVVHVAGQHFWPLGLNYPSEVHSSADLVNHGKVVQAIHDDMGWTYYDAPQDRKLMVHVEPVPPPQGPVNSAEEADFVAGSCQTGSSGSSAFSLPMAAITLLLWIRRRRRPRAT